jgi:hypothetical protein
MYQHSTIEEGMVWEKVILVKVFCEESDVDDVENGEIHILVPTVKVLVRARTLL